MSNIFEDMTHQWPLDPSGHDSNDSTPSTPQAHGPQEETVTPADTTLQPASVTSDELEEAAAGILTAARVISGRLVSAAIAADAAPLPPAVKDALAQVLEAHAQQAAEAGPAS